MIVEYDILVPKMLSTLILGERKRNQNMKLLIELEIRHFHEFQSKVLKTKLLILKPIKVK